MKIGDKEIEFTDKDIPKINKMIREHNESAVTLKNVIRFIKRLFI